MMITKFIDWVRFVLGKKKWVLVSEKFETISGGSSDCVLREPLAYQTITERCVLSGIHRVTRRGSPSCFASGGVYNGAARAENGCGDCGFIEECSKFRKE